MQEAKNTTPSSADLNDINPAGSSGVLDMFVDTANGLEMNAEHEAHLARIKEQICERIDSKYRAGQREHGGRLWTKPVLNEILDEVVDLAVYVLTLQEQIERHGNPVK